MGRDSASLQHNAWTLEEMQLLENASGQLHHDGIGAPIRVEVNDNLLPSSPSLLSGIDEASQLFLFNTPNLPNLNISSHLHTQPQTRGTGDFNFSGISSSPDISSTASQALPTTRGTGMSLLHVAAQNGHCNIIQMLVNHHVDINEQDSAGTTALHIAVRNRHDGAIRLLLQCGADIHTDDQEGCSPLFLAVRMGFEDVVRLFLSHTTDLGANGQGIPELRTLARI